MPFNDAFSILTSLRHFGFHLSADDSSEKFGFLSSLLGNGCECHGYKLIIVGHSLGGAVATLLGVRVSM